MNAQQSEFLKSTVPAAQAAQRKSGVPASITLAQAILETGWGRSALAVKGNNFFGIKASAYAMSGYVLLPTFEFVGGERVRKLARFSSYPSPEASFDAHSALMSVHPRYKPAMAVRNDPFEFARRLQAGGYSTDPNYAAKLIQLMLEFDLTQYDIAPDGPAKEAVA